MLLGFPLHTTCITIYFDVNFQEVKYVTHLQYGERINDLQNFTQYTERRW